MSFLARVLTSTLAILLVTHFLPGVSVDNVITAIVLAVVLSILNMFIKPLLILLTLPITVFTLGFFLLVINAAIILMASSLVKGFYVKGFWYALLFSIVLSIVTSIFESLQKPKQSGKNDF